MARLLIDFIWQRRQHECEIQTIPQSETDQQAKRTATTTTSTTSTTAAAAAEQFTSHQSESIRID